MKTRSLQIRTIQKESVDVDENLSPTDYLYVQNLKGRHEEHFVTCCNIVVGGHKYLYSKLLNKHHPLVVHWVIMNIASLSMSYIDKY